MAIDWVHLPKEVMDKICQCSGKKGYRYDPATGYFPCGVCGKPSLLVGVRECDICEKPFVPKFYDKIAMQHFGIMCDECDPPTVHKEALHG